MDMGRENWISTRSRARAAMGGAALLTMAGWAAPRQWSRSPRAGYSNTFGQTYNATADLHACGGDCLVVANNRITINLKGHSIIQDCPTPFGPGSPTAGSPGI